MSLFQAVKSNVSDAVGSAKKKFVKAARNEIKEGYEQGFEQLGISQAKNNESSHSPKDALHKDPVVDDQYRGMLAKTPESQIKRTALEQSVPDDSARLDLTRVLLAQIGPQQPRKDMHTTVKNPHMSPEQEKQRAHTQNYFNEYFIRQRMINQRKEEQEKQQQKADEEWEKRAFEQQKKERDGSLGKKWAQTNMEAGKGHGIGG